jgi:SM-20-related protein
MNQQVTQTNTDLAARVRVIDGLIPADLQVALNRLMIQPRWAYGWKSNSEKDRYSFWHRHFAGGDLHNRISCAEALKNAPEHEAVYRVWDLLSKTVLQGHEPLRAYGNAHTFGCEGYIHVDNRDTDNYFSTIIYTNPEWKAFWGGETLFYSLDEKDIIKAAAAVPFRIVTFPGHIPHKANAPARDCPGLRTALVFKSHVGANYQPEAPKADAVGAPPRRVAVMPTAV